MLCQIKVPVDGQSSNFVLACSACFKMEGELKSCLEDCCMVSGGHLKKEERICINRISTKDLWLLRHLLFILSDDLASFVIFNVPVL